jgi:hypothetical protein
MLGPLNQLEASVGHQTGHLLGWPTRANIFGAVDEERRYFQTRYRSQQGGLLNIALPGAVDLCRFLEKTPAKDRDNLALRG